MWTTSWWRAQSAAYHCHILAGRTFDAKVQGLEVGGQTLTVTPGACPVGFAGEFVIKGDNMRGVSAVSLILQAILHA